MNRFALSVVLALSLSLAAFADTPQWTSGVFVYNSRGEVTNIGSDVYRYDSAGRLISGTAAATHRQDYTYDSFGNLIRTTTATALQCVGGIPCELNRPVDASTNRIATSAAEYDLAGNLTKLDGNYSYDYDSVGMLAKSTTPAGTTTYIYTADNERIAVYAEEKHEWSWTLRDLKGAPLRTFTSQDGGAWRWGEDFVHGPSGLLATAGPDSGRRHAHLDHLGTPRVITDDERQLSEHVYFAFGAELDIANRATPRTPLQFTGHERDATGDVHQLDYMHARYYSAAMARFLSVDPGRDWDMHQPQSWNLYSYVRNDPINKTDPTGRWVETLWDGANVVLGVRSFVKNVRAGNYGAATVDAVGVVIDSAAVVTPVVPGGVGTAIKIARNADRLDDMADVTRTANAVSDGTRAGALPKPPTGKGSVAPADRDPQRTFSPTQREAKRAEQGGVCANGCGTKIDESNSAGHHIQRHADGGKTNSANHAEVCVDCHKKLHARQ